MAKPVIDFHVHVMPDFVKGRFPAGLRDRARRAFKPIASTLHQLQPTYRLLPEGIRRRLDEIANLAPIPALFMESTPADLKNAMDEAGLSHALIVAQPPSITNEFVLDLGLEERQFIPVVNIPQGTARPGATLKKMQTQGARALKIHPAFDGEGPRSSRYLALLKAAAEIGMPVIVHTGKLHASLIYKDPTMGDASAYIPWFKGFPSVQFILNHMNFHEPLVALDIANEFQNVWVDTAWQPAEVIAEAARVIGASRVLFASDWPFLGNNIDVGLQRIRDCVDAGLLREDDAELILGGNAARLLKLESTNAS